MGIEEMGLAAEGEGFVRDRARGSSGRPPLVLGLGLDGPGGRPSGEGAGWALEGCGFAGLRAVGPALCCAELLLSFSEFLQTGQRYRKEQRAWRR